MQRCNGEMRYTNTYRQSSTHSTHIVPHMVREVRLEQLSTCQCARLVVGIDQEKARLQQMMDRLAAETDEERQARLQQMRDRLAAETDEERQCKPGCNRYND